MKKTYITPSTKVYNVMANKHLMAASGLKSTSAGILDGGSTGTNGINSADSKDYVLFGFDLYETE